MYAKIENGKLIPAENGYNGITGFADNVELMLENGFKFYDDSDFSLYSVGATWNLTVGSGNEFYKYYRIDITNSSPRAGIGELEMSAVYIAV